MKKTEQSRRALSVHDVVLLAAPHTWAASTVPSFFAAVLARSLFGKTDAVMFVCTLLAAILMQSAANTFNDYSDFVKGTDTLDNSPDPGDAVIVYGLEPKYSLFTGIAFLFAAGCIGGYTVLVRGVVPLIIGLIGAITLLAYSFGKTPISYLPLGEAVSGFVMGGLIPLAGFYLQTGTLSFSVLACSMPLMLGTALIMFTNNGCDIDRDTAAKRTTLPILFGGKATQTAYKTILTVWMLLPAVILAALFSAKGALIYICTLTISAPAFSRQLTGSLSPDVRAQKMAGITLLNELFGLQYMLAILLGV